MQLICEWCHRVSHILNFADHIPVMTLHLFLHPLSSGSIFWPKKKKILTWYHIFLSRGTQCLAVSFFDPSSHWRWLNDYIWGWKIVISLLPFCHLSWAGIRQCKEKPSQVNHLVTLRYGCKIMAGKVLSALLVLASFQNSCSILQKNPNRCCCCFMHVF